MAGGQEGSKADAVARWQRRPLAAAAVRVLALLLPLAGGIVAGAVVGRRLPPAATLPGFLASFAAVTACSMAVAWGVDRIARRLLPLAALLNLSLLFPDNAPSRYKVALRSGSVRQLERQVEAAKTMGLGGDAVEAAEKIIELASALNAHDRMTRGHAERVRAYADLLANELKLPAADRDRLHWAALLHDVGKIFVHPHILNKDGKPDDHEWEILRRHPEEGGRLAAPLAEWLGPWSLAIAEHHESYDGRGYPRQLAGEDISYGARIVAVADAYDVMTSARSYKRPMPAAAARLELTRCAGKQFDPAVVRAFLNIGLGRLRWAMGPLSSVFQLPMLGRLESLVPQLGWAARAATGAAALAAGGMLSSDLPAPPAPVALTTAAPATAPDYQPLPGALFDRPAEMTSPPTTTTPPTVPAVEPVPEPLRPPAVPTPTTPTTPTTQRMLPPAAPAPAVVPTSTPTTAPGPVPAPVRDLAIAAKEDEPVTIALFDLLEADALDLDPSTLLVARSAGSGTVVVDAGRGVLTYVPDPGFIGTDRFRYRVCTPAAICGEAEIAVQVDDVLWAPTAGADVAILDEDAGATALPVLANDGDLDDDLVAATLQVVVEPRFGTVAVAPGRLIYTPAADRNGSDELTYRICDRTDRCADAAVRIDVTPVNDPPGFTVPAAVVVTEDDPAATLAVVTDATGGPADEANEALRFTVEAADPALLTGPPTIDDEGRVRLQPLADVSGITTLRIVATDPSGAASAATTTLRITAAPDRPIGVDDVASTPEDTPVVVNVLGNDTDADGDALSVTSATGPTSVNPDGSITFSPPADVNGPVSFTYTVTDGSATATATVGLTITAANDAPQFTAGPIVSVVATSGGQTLPGWATAIAAGPPDEAGQSLAFTLTPADPSLFAAAAAPAIDAAGTLRFTPSGLPGSTFVTAVLTDAEGATSSATFTIELLPPRPTSPVISEYAHSSPTSSEDDFVELFNPTPDVIDLSGHWLWLTKNDGTPESIERIPSGTLLAPGAHYLFAGADFVGAFDQRLIGKIEASVGLQLTSRSGALLDRVGAAASPYFEGTPLPALTDRAYESYERRDGGGFGNCIDTDDNAADFVHHQASGTVVAQHSGSPVTPCTFGPPAPPSTAVGLVISEFRTRGPDGGKDEFVELFNAGSTQLSLAGWRLTFGAGATEETAYTFDGGIVGPGAHVLLGGENWSGPEADGRYGAGGGLLTGLFRGLLGLGENTELKEKSTVRLYGPDGSLVDSVGLTEGEPGGEGERLLSLTETGGSYERRAGDGLGSCVDTGDNASDFRHRLIGAGPQNLASVVTPCRS